MTAVSEFRVCPVLGLWQVSKEELFFVVVILSDCSNETF